MFKEVKRFFCFLGAYASANLQAAMEYRTSFITQVIFMFLNNLMLLFFWWVLFTQIDHLNGWQFNHILALYAISAGSFGCQALLFGGSFGLSGMISGGQLDHYLSLPRPPLLHILISRSSSAAWGDLAFSALLYIFAVGGEWSHLLWFPFFLLSGGLVMTFFTVIIHSVSFWLGQSSGLASQLYEALLSFSLYPEAIFNLPVRFILYTLIPAAFVSQIPVRLLIGESPLYVLALVGSSLVLGFFSRWFFYLGLKRYESGNLVVVQV